MKGCSKKRHRTRKGGMKPIGGLKIRGGNSPAFVGDPYTIDKGGNYYDLQKNFSLDRNYQLRGGTLIPTNLLNVGRNISYGFESVINGVGGFEAPVSPDPYNQTQTRI